MFDHAQANLMIAEVVSLTGSPIFPSDLKVTWAQTSGDTIEMSQLESSSNPLRLTTLSLMESSIPSESMSRPN